MKNYLIRSVNSEKDVHGILALQQQNLRKNLSQKQIQEQGFVTVSHRFEVLKAMNQAQPSVIATDFEDNVVAYCLAMLPQFRWDVPELFVLFELLDSLEHQGKALKNTAYCVMGQVCVGKDYRGQGVFEAMNQYLKKMLKNRFECCITDISSQNQRSLKAHQKVGYKIIHTFFDEHLQENWLVVAWDWQE